MSTLTGNTDEAVEQFTRPVVKLILALVGLLVLRFIVTNLPGLGTRIPGAPISFSTVAGGIITVIMVAIIANFGREIEPRIVKATDDPAGVAADLAEAVKFLVFLVAIILAYDGLSAVVVPFLIPDPGRWTYDILFLLIALVPTAIIAQRMFNNLDDMTDLLTKQVKSATVESVNCTECGEEVRASLDFCPHCGAEVVTEQGSATPTSTESTTSCPDCGSDVDPSASFCGSCGTSVAD